MLYQLSQLGFSLTIILLQLSGSFSLFPHSFTCSAIPQIITESFLFFVGMVEQETRQYTSCCWGDWDRVPKANKRNKVEASWGLSEVSLQKGH